MPGIPGIRKDYNASLYQLDETIKLCIRSARHAPETSISAVRQCLCGMLPTDDPELERLDIRYAWGVWFQVLWALIVLQDRSKRVLRRRDLCSLISSSLQLIERRGYLPTFTSELENPDYAGFRDNLLALGVL